MTLPANDATRAQIAASAPDRSTWVAANAGSGKTRVLTDRVARLLLQRVLPQRILCLTYTKAAAAEMQNRLFERLGAWAMLPEPALRRALAELGEPEAAAAADLGPARRLFARALEAPGGLKIQTIHSFCDQILRRFPVEAGVSPQFEVLEDRQAEQLRRQCLEDLARNDPDGVLGGLAGEVDSSGLQALISAILAQASAFAQPFDEPALRAALGHPSHFDPTQAALELRQMAGASRLQALAEAYLANPTESQRLRGAALSRVLSSQEDPGAALTALLPHFVKADGAANTRVANNQLREALPGADDIIATVSERLVAIEDARRAEVLISRSRTLHAFAQRFVSIYAERKAQLGRLDYDDLIGKVRGLLSDSAAAAWVLYKLDGGVEHILVDEAQDTSPAQWQVVQALTEEFFAGDSAQTRPRTVFVVGDEKQSIYSFQGAQPDAFGHMKTWFSEALTPLDDVLQDCALLYSFRSAAPILKTVDAVFHLPEAMGLDAQHQHLAFKSDMSGSVTLWPFERAEAGPERAPWYEPVDQGAVQRPEDTLAREIAATLTDWFDTGATLPGEANPIRPGDVMILVRRRGPMFNAILRALEEARVPVAGTDRLKLTEALAVQDLMSLLRFLATPTDDLALAEVLRSPLGGISEEDLFTLAHGRPRLEEEGRNLPLWRRVWEAKETHPALFKLLKDLRDQADFLRPFELLERALVLHEGRAALTGRLGPEAEDAIDALLNSALAYEQVEAPNLTGFIEWFAAQEVEVKREFAQDLNQVRVMTVHGAKGLEAPIVFLPDTAKRSGPGSLRLGTLAEQPVWPSSSGTNPAIWQEERNRLQALDEAEDWRLLYVAMTRAERALIVCGAGKDGQDGSGSWYDAVAQGLAALETEEGPDGTLVFGDLGLEHRGEGTEEAQTASHMPPSWARDKVSVPQLRPIHAPSDLGGAHALAGSAEDAIPDSPEDLRTRGTQIHLLLEHLPRHPAAQHKALAASLLRDITPDDALLEDLLAEVSPLLSDPNLAQLFAPGTLAEIPVFAELDAQGRPAIQGTIDRLVIAEDHVLLVDFKSNRDVPKDPSDIPAGILRQLGAYAAALAQIFPTHRIEPSVLWTRTGQLMSVPHSLVSDALQSAFND